MTSRTRGNPGTTENPSQRRTVMKEFLVCQQFLACQHLLSKEEILEFLSGEESQDGDDSISGTSDQRIMRTWIRHKHDSCDENFQLRQAFRRRTAEIRRLEDNLRNGLGGARIDEDSRLVPVTEPPQPPRADLPPVGQNVDNNPNPNDNLQFDPNQEVMQENQEALLLDQKRRETEFTIEQAVRELRRENQPNGPVPEEEFEVILLDQKGRPRVEEPGTFFQNDNDINDGNTLFMHPALQRIAFGCFSMVFLIICLTLKVLPISSLINMKETVDKSFDPLLNEVLVTKNWKDHVRECSGGLVNRSADHYDHKWEWFNRIQRSLLSENITSDCSDGVLHIPSRKALYNDMEDKDWKYSGVDVSWFVPCSEHSVESSRQQHCDTRDESTNECPGSLGHKDQPSRKRCFRGIHDDFVGRMEIDAALNMADLLIGTGGDHFDIHYQSPYLFRMVPTIVKKMACLLDTRYLNQHSENPRTYEECVKGDATKIKNLQPVAFRVLTTGPIDGHDVKLKQEKGDKMTMYLTHSTALNETNYLNWVLKSRKHNDKSRYQSYYRPWPYRLPPKRETCDLKYDLQDDSRFCIQTSLYLTSGAGEHYWGGTDLFVDDHPSNFASPKRKIARGVSIDGTMGRLVVSTGGFENLNCRFPTRAGFKSVLQIWWNC